jgi:alpha,alpha-trehalase
MPELASALDRWEELGPYLREKRPAVFLDYDGTLTPIVARPELAVLAEEMRRTVRMLAARCPVAIVSGRDRTDVQRLVRIEGLIYAGSHGFDIAGPDLTYEQGHDFLASLDRAEHNLLRSLSGVDGARVERKKFSIAVHFREVPPQHTARLEPIVDAVLRRCPDLRKSLGKKVFELRPAIDWHKGKAVLWLLEALGFAGTDALPVYIGDDVTDEDAFSAVAGRGLGILVAKAPRVTAAGYRLKNTAEVRIFLHKLTTVLGLRSD